MPSPSSRRTFLAAGGGLAAWSLAPGTQALQEADTTPVTIDDVTETPAAPPSIDVDAITEQTLREAEKLAGVRWTDDEPALILESIDEDVQRFVRRRSHALENRHAPALTFDPRLPGVTYPEGPSKVVADLPGRGMRPPSDVDLAYAPVAELAALIRDRRMSSQELTRLHLDRLAQLDPQLQHVVTRMEDAAMRQARAADVALAGGDRRGPLHGIPWGAKDLFDTAGVRTTWGATPYRNRTPDRNAVVVDRLAQAGAVLTAKLTLGALAYGDIWFGGRTNNPFNIAQGSSGSSAGSAAAVAAGCVGFALGTETLGSIVSPSMRCGTTGLRPTFGRVPRTGAMALCWSLDKIGPMARTVQDCLLVLDAIHGADAGDPSSRSAPLTFDASRDAGDVTLGYDPSWFENGSSFDRAALDAARQAGMTLKEIELPDWPYDALLTILFVEAAAAFESLTLSDRDDELVWQSAAAWPNAFRSTRFTPAIEYVQADRFRRIVMNMMHETMSAIDVIIAPSFAGSLLLITNATGHPSLTLRTGLRENGTPTGITLIGRLFEEGTLGRAGMALERELDVWHRRPFGE